jgi:hypothetical protein
MATVLLERDECEGIGRGIRMLWKGENKMKLSEDGLTGGCTC